jgi:hypothetical protein
MEGQAREEIAKCKMSVVAVNIAEDNEECGLPLAFCNWHFAIS